MYLPIPFNLYETYGERGHLKAKISLDNNAYAGYVVPLGDNLHVVGVNPDMQERLDKDVGDTVHVKLEFDMEPRTGAVPPDFQTALGNHPSAKAFFNSLSSEEQQAFTNWISSAKRESTRTSRLYKVIEKLLNQEKTP